MADIVKDGVVEGCSQCLTLPEDVKGSVLLWICAAMMMQVSGASLTLMSCLERVLAKTVKDRGHRLGRTFLLFHVQVVVVAVTTT